MTPPLLSNPPHDLWEAFDHIWSDPPTEGIREYLNLERQPSVQLLSLL